MFNDVMNSNDEAMMTPVQPATPQPQPAPPQEKPPAHPATQPKSDPFEPAWPQTRPTPQPKGQVSIGAVGSVFDCVQFERIQCNCVQAGQVLSEPIR